LRLRTIAIIVVGNASVAGAQQDPGAAPAATDAPVAAEAPVAAAAPTAAEVPAAADGSAAVDAEPEAGAEVAATEEVELPRLFVVDLRAESGVDPSHVRLLNEIMLGEVQRIERFEVFGEADLKSMVEMEQSKQLMGCESDVSCLAEIGGALGADLSLSGAIGALGDLYVLSLKIISNRQTRVVGRWSETVEGEPSVMVESIKGGVAEVVAGALGLDPNVLRATPKVEEPTPIYKTWWLWTVVGVVAAGTGAAIAVGVATGGSSSPSTVIVNATLPLP